MMWEAAHASRMRCGQGPSASLYDIGLLGLNAQLGYPDGGNRCCFSICRRAGTTRCSCLLNAGRLAKVSGR